MEPAFFKKDARIYTAGQEKGAKQEPQAAGLLVQLKKDADLYPFLTHCRTNVLSSVCWPVSSCTPQVHGPHAGHRGERAAAVPLPAEDR